MFVAHYIRDMNNKKDRIKFVSKANELIERANISNFVFQVFPEVAQKDIYLVFGRFNESQRIGNPYTGKYNFNSSQSVEMALNEFDVYLTSIKEALL